MDKLIATRVASGLSAPVFVTAPPADSRRLFIVEKVGRIRILDLERGVRQFVVGTGGRSLRAFGGVQPHSEVRDNTAFGVLHLRLRDGRYDWRFVPQPGRSFTDSGTAACH